MKDFSKIIDAVQARHLQDARDGQERERRVADERQALRRAATEFLDTEIRPHLKAAQQQLVARNFPLRIKDNWTGQLTSQAPYHIAAVIEGPERQNAVGGITRPRSRTAFFIHNGKSFSVGFSKGNSEDTHHPEGARPSSLAQTERKVDEIIEFLLDGYLDDVAKHKQSGNW
jgi:hypothetical protein